MTKNQVMIIEKEESVRNQLKSTIENEGYDVLAYSSGLEVETYLQKSKAVGIVIKDLQALKHFHKTNFAQESQALLRARVGRAEGVNEDRYWFISKSESMQKVNEVISALQRESMKGSAKEPTVLLLGEAGTGKEGVARQIHAGSRRGNGPWISVNCGDFTEHSLESEIFGHEKGAHAGAVSLKYGALELAQSGTLFLNEVTALGEKLQSKFLGFLEKGTYRRVGGTEDLSSDVRVIASTNYGIGEILEKNMLRSDLKASISKFEIEIPALRNRKDEIVKIAHTFLEAAFSSCGKRFSGLTPEAERTLENHPWPGNLREMLNMSERIALLWKGNGPVADQHLGLQNTQGSAATSEGFKMSALPSLSEDGYMDLKRKWSDRFEYEYLSAALGRHGGNVSAAAREAKIDRSNFLRLLRRHGLNAQGFRKAA